MIKFGWILIVMIGFFSFTSMAENFQSTIKDTNSVVVFDLSNAISSGNYIDVPVTILSSDSIFSLDFSFQFNENNFIYISVINVPSYIDPLAYYNSTDKTLRFTSYSLQQYEINKPLGYIHFYALVSIITAADIFTVKAYLNGQLVKYKVKTQSSVKASAINDGPVCANKPIKLTAGPDGMKEYSWKGPGGFQAKGQIAIVTNPNAGLYNLIITNLAGDTSVTSTLVGVYPLPLADAGADQSLCIGSSIDLTGSGGLKYSWSTGETLNKITVKPLKSSIYKLSVSDINSCSASDSVKITVNALPIVEAGLPQTICSGSPVILTASGGLFYKWNSGALTASFTAQPLFSSTYFVTVTDLNNCAAIDSVEVSVNQSPRADAGLPQSICIGNSATLTAFGGLNYRWSTGEQNATIITNPLVSTTYSVTVSDKNQCTGSESVKVTVLQLPTASVTGASILCKGDYADLSVAFTGKSPWVFVYNDGSQKTIITSDNPYHLNVNPLTNIAYQLVSIEDANLCKQNLGGAFPLEVQPKPIINLGKDTMICDDELVLDAKNPGANYLWSTGEITRKITVPKDEKIVSLVVTINGCSSNDTINILSCKRNNFAIPKAFSPNNDGIDDMLFLLGNSVKRMNLMIYNRFGELVFESKNQNIGWDGTYRGRDCEVEVYAYYLKVTIDSGETIEQSGNISLLR